MSPILVRPVREQLEHDRIIRLLQPKYKRRFVPAINPGGEMNQAVGEGSDACYPDVVLFPLGKGRKVAAIIEVETRESVNSLEAKAQWAVYGRLPIEFWLYVPAIAVESAKRLCQDNQVGVTEIWTYHAVGDQIRFTQVYRSPVELKIAAAKAAAAAAAAERREAERLEEAARRATARKAAKAVRPKRGAAKAAPAKTLKTVKPSPARKTAKAVKTAKKSGGPAKKR